MVSLADPAPAVQRDPDLDLDLRVRQHGPIAAEFSARYGSGLAEVAFPIDRGDYADEYLPTADEEAWLWGYTARENDASRIPPGRYSGSPRSAWLAGFDEAAKAMDREVWLWGFRSGERFELRLAPTHLGSTERLVWARGYDEGRALVEAEAAESFEVAVDEANDWPF